MNKRKFMISSMLAAGFGGEMPALAQDTVFGADAEDGSIKNAVFQRFALDHAFILAGHRSHSSHSSHSSHRSGAGGYGVYTPTYPAYSPPPPSPPPSPRTAPAYRPQPLFDATPSVPAERSAPRPLTGRSELFTSIVKRVQLGLMAYGYYEGPVDGAVGSGTREAIRRLQTDYKLNVTGTVTPEVLDALRITAR